MILIDTDALIEILDKHSDAGMRLSEKVIASGEEFCTSAINMHEILYGYVKYSKSIDEILLLRVLEYTKADALLSSELEAAIPGRSNAELRSDAMIAAIAINHGCKLLTGNRKDFENFKSIEFF